MIDIHCHILPGIDDGPEDMDGSLAMLRLAAEDGVRTVVATPHFGGRYDLPAPATIRSLTRRLNEVADAAGIEARVLPGCEAELVPDLPEQLRSGEALTLGDAGRYVLVEVLPLPIPLYALDVHFRLRLAGYVPILAHVERVAITADGLQFAREFVAQGGLAQVNADSVGGQVGRAAQRVCSRLFDEGLFHIIASDGHSTTSRPPLLTPCLRGFTRQERLQALARYCSLELSPAPAPD